MFDLPWLFVIVLRMMTLAVPDPQPLYRHGELATAISSECQTDPFGDRDPFGCAADTVALGTFESSLRKDAVGDGGHSVGAFQCYGCDRRLLEDATLAVRTAHRMMKQSRRVDPRHRFAFYARGPRFRSAEAVELSDHRAALADRLRRQATP